MPNYKKFYIEFCFEIVGQTRFLGIKRTKKFESDYYAWSLITKKTLSEVEKEFEIVKKKKTEKLKGEIERSLINKGKYSFQNCVGDYHVFYDVYIIKPKHKFLIEEIDFSKVSIECAFKNLTIEQFKEVWGEQFPTE